MTHSIFHSKSSVKKWGGIEADYQPIHDWLDATKALMPDCRHRALRHHSQGVFDAECVFGIAIINADGKTVPVREIAERHIREDCAGLIPTPQDWLTNIPIQGWMNRGYTDKS